MNQISKRTLRIDCIEEEEKTNYIDTNRFLLYLLFHVFVPALKSALVRKYLAVIRRAPVRQCVTHRYYIHLALTVGVAADVLLFVLVKLMPKSVR